MRILLIEDEKKTLAYLEKGLSESGYAVDMAEDGENGLQLALSGNYNLIILDVMLPQKDGWAVLTELRESGQKTPVIFLTAMDRVGDRVRGLELGADDYLVKPFAFSELIARVHSVLRRSSDGNLKHQSKFKVADLELDVKSHNAFRGGKRLDLTPKEFNLLSLLIRKPGEALSRTLIAEHVWNMHFDSETNVVDVHIRRLRSKMDDLFDLKLVHTVRGVGYVLEDRG